MEFLSNLLGANELKVNFEEIVYIVTAFWIMWIILTSFHSFEFNDCLFNAFYSSIYK